MISCRADLFKHMQKLGCKMIFSIISYSEGTSWRVHIFFTERQSSDLVHRIEILIMGYDDFKKIESSPYQDKYGNFIYRSQSMATEGAARENAREVIRGIQLMSFVKEVKVQEDGDMFVEVYI